MSYGILLIRVVLGATVAGHGTQKLFGWWNGPGLSGFSGWLGSMNMRSPYAQAVLVGLAELGGGMLLALGLLTPFAALAIASVMVVAIALVHWQKGFWVSNGGFEFNLLILASAAALAATGAGRFSLDRLFGWVDNLSGVWWGVGVLAAAAIVALTVVTLGRRREESGADRRLRAA
jgi:putative oxidoreductase